jgi:hypothetical protein
VKSFSCSYDVAILHSWTELSGQWESQHPTERTRHSDPSLPVQAGSWGPTPHVDTQHAVRCPSLSQLSPVPPSTSWFTSVKKGVPLSVSHTLACF